MDLTEEQRDFAEAIRGFCAAECGTPEQRAALTSDGRLADSPVLLAKMASQGLLGVSLPEEYGGGGAGFLDEVVFLEATSRGLAPVAAYGTGLTAAQTYLRWGTDVQKRTVVENLVGGRFEAIALSEPGAGSDLGSVSLRARVDGPEYVLNGQKTWITAAHLAEHVLVLCREDATRGKHQGLTLLMVPTNLTGIEIREIPVMQAHTVNDVFFSDVRVPREAVVGTAGDAWAQLMRGLGIERLIIAAMSLGSAQRSLDDAISYLRQREQFGVPIATFQALRHRVADLATSIETARAFLYDAAHRVDLGVETDLARHSAMAKLRCTSIAKDTALEAMQLMGGAGYAVEHGVEAQVRRALAPPIYGGTNEIQRDIIAKTLL